MLPQAYEPAAALGIALGGALACFAGHRVFRLVLAVYGFILGAMMASSMMAANNTIGMVVATVIGGILGALILVFAYFVAIALIGAAAGAIVAHVAWTEFARVDAPALVVIGSAIAGAVGAMLLQRYVIIIGTAFGGAWTLIVGALALMRDRGVPRPASTNHVWILYPFAPAPGQRWLPLTWAALGVIGTVVQLGITARRR